MVTARQQMSAPVLAEGRRLSDAKIQAERWYQQAPEAEEQGTMGEGSKTAKLVKSLLFGWSRGWGIGMGFNFGNEGKKQNVSADLAKEFAEDKAQDPGLTDQAVPSHVMRLGSRVF